MRRWVLGVPVLTAAVVLLLLPSRATVAGSSLMLGAAAALAPEVTRYFSPGEFARGQAYAQGLYWLAAAGISFRLALLACLVFTPASAALRRLALRWARGRLALATALYLIALGIGYEVLALPLRLYRGFIWEHAFHLSRQTPSAWFLDWGKECLLFLVLIVPLGMLLVALWRHAPQSWALWAWAGCGCLTVLLVALAPLVLDPLFNTIRPLQDPAMRQRILTLAGRAGLPVDQVYVSDASRRTRAENAYFTGLGATKRIILYDTLLRHEDPDAVASVVAHEMGHWKHADIWKGLGWTLLGLAVGFWCLARVLAWAGRGRRFHLTGPADMAALPLVLLVFLGLTVVSLPLQNAISRRMERAADRTALELTQDPAAFIRSEVQLARAGLVDLAPPRAVVLLLYTHPPTMERIRMAERFAARPDVTQSAPTLLRQTPKAP
jgi:STE24 endopeptidase